MNTEKTVEDYLEAMLMIREEKGAVRSVDVADHLGVKKPSVTYATKMLKQKGLITMDEDNFIILTQEGMKIASSTYDRHKLLTKVFTKLGVDEQTAMEDACRVEHDLSPATYKAIEEYVKKCCE